MKIKRTLFVLFLTGLLLAACGKAPEEEMLPSADSGSKVVLVDNEISGTPEMTEPTKVPEPFKTGDVTESVTVNQETADEHTDNTDELNQDITDETELPGDNKGENVPVEVLEVETARIYVADDYSEEGVEKVRVRTAVAYAGDMDRYPALSDALKLYNENKLSLANGMYERLESIYNEEEELNDGALNGPYVSEDRCLVMRADSLVTSLLEYSLYYAGGVHGIYEYNGVVFDSQTGDILTLDDIVAEGVGAERLAEAVRAEIDLKYPGLSSWEFTPEGYIEETLEDGRRSFTVDYDGVTFYFNPYEIGPFSAGAQKVKLTFKKYPDLFRGRLTMVPECYTVDFTPEAELFMDTDGDGECEYITYSSVNVMYEDISDFDATVHVKVSETAYDYDYDTTDGSTYSDWIFYYEISAAFVHTSDGDYIHLRTVHENDAVSYTILALKGNELSYAGEIFGTVSGTYHSDILEEAERLMEKYKDGSYMYDFRVSFDPEGFLFTTRDDIFGTTFEHGCYHVGKDGVPVSDSEWYYLNSPYQYLVTTKTDMNVAITNENADAPDEEIFISAGTRLGVVRGNLEGSVDCVIVDDEKEVFDTEGKQWVRLIFDAPESDWSDYRAYISGIHMDELFDGINHAG